MTTSKDLEQKNGKKTQIWTDRTLNSTIIIMNSSSLSLVGNIQNCRAFCLQAHSQRLVSLTYLNMDTRNNKEWSSRKIGCGKDFEYVTGSVSQVSDSEAVRLAKGAPHPYFLSSIFYSDAEFCCDEKIIKKTLLKSIYCSKYMYPGRCITNLCWGNTIAQILLQKRQQNMKMQRFHVSFYP